ncbi:hypothetical protein EV421DRAFT_1968973 [Armillaria borealis]|uniref:Uncharacterized protein n=1 Tax=Armillaria borealis TaxID=47425 RepID=A0AA39JBF1_9AGAR|nr:hypothetical protein EV421DRAFT_1968973 [Armillaria borealis]
MSQLDPDFASIKLFATQYSDSWLNAVIIESLTHGMYTALLSVVLTLVDMTKLEVPPVVSRATIYGRQVKVLAGISVFMYTMVTMHLAMRWFYARWAFITKGETDEMRYHALIDWTATGINILVVDSVIIWRCWIIWDRNWRTIILPCIYTLCGLMFDLFSLLQLPALEKSSINVGIVFYALVLPTMIICTMLIVYRLSNTSKTRNSSRFMPNPYFNVIEMLVESSALYVGVLAIFIMFEATNSPYSRYPQAVLVSVTGIGPALILLRVVSRSTDTAFTAPAQNKNGRQ